VLCSAAKPQQQKIMKTILKTLLFSALALGAIVACEQKKTETTDTAPSASPATVQKYTCPMHPEVIQDGPGKCPKCGMDLVPKT
jgi:hypothetical protein